MLKKILFTGLILTLVSGVNAQETGEKLFTDHCASCHGTDGNGGELGPNIATRVPLRSDEELAVIVQQGLGAAGMPAGWSRQFVRRCAEHCWRRGILR